MEWNTIRNTDCLGTEGLATLPTNSVHLFFLDLPFGVTHNSQDLRINLKLLWPELIRIGTEHAVFVFFAVEPFRTDLINENRALFRYDLIWVKEKGTNCFNATKRPLNCHESILIFSKMPNMTFNPQFGVGKPYQKLKQAKIQGVNYNQDSRSTILTESEGKRFPITVLYFPRDHANQGLNPTQKPLALCENLVKSYSNKKEVIVDPTMGSGSSILASLALERQYFGFEIDRIMFRRVEKRIKYFRYSGKDEIKRIKREEKNLASQASLFSY